MSADTYAETLKSTLATATKAPVYDLDEAQGLAALPANYTLIFLSRRLVGNARMDGIRDSFGWRLSTRVVSKTITNARLLEERIGGAFNLTTLTLGGEPVHLAYESGGGDFAYDEGYFTALTDWTFVR